MNEDEVTEKDANKLRDVVDDIPLDRLKAICNAERDGRCVVLPCKPEADVYTIEEKYYDCAHCEHKAAAKYDTQTRRTCCDIEGIHCPYYIETHSAEAFSVDIVNGKWEISLPGEWGDEGIEEFYGIGGKAYFTSAEVVTALLHINIAKEE